VAGVSRAGVPHRPVPLAVEPAVERSLLFTAEVLTGREDGVCVVDATYRLGSGRGQPLAYRSADILAVDEVPFDTKLLGHQEMHGVGDRLACRDVAVGDGGKAESREGRRHHVGLLKSSGERQHLHEGVRPPVQHHHGRCSRCLRPLVDKVHPHSTDICRELRERVDARLELPPVEPAQPVVHQLAKVIRRDPGLPRGSRCRPREPRPLEPDTQVVQRCVRDVDAEWVHVQIMYRHPPHRASQRHARHSRPGRDTEVSPEVVDRLPG
jgi:hypothetical protein